MNSKISTALSIIGFTVILMVVTAPTLANHQAVAQKETALTVNVSPDTMGASSYDVTGKLTSDGSGVGGATITFTWYMSGLGLNPTYSPAKILSPAVTNADGTYSVTGSITRSSVIAHYAGDSEHSPANSKLFALKMG
jgi:hypothetical protein